MYKRNNIILAATAIIIIIFICLSLVNRNSPEIPNQPVQVVGIPEKQTPCLIDEDITYRNCKCEGNLVENICHEIKP